MYTAYWGLKKQPFQNVPDPEFFFHSEFHDEALARLIYAVTSNKGAALLTGEIGSGKTLVTRTLIDKLDKDRYEIGLVTNPSLSLNEFLKEISYQLGTKSVPDTKVEILRKFNEVLISNYKQKKGTVLIIDDAQAIYEKFIWEELRLFLNFQLNNRFLITLIIVGQPEVNKTVLDIRQLNQRFYIKYHINPFDLEQTTKYIVFRLKKAGANRGIFTKEALQLIYDFCQGIPREINKLCDISLLTAYVNKSKLVDSSTITKILYDKRRYK